MTYKQANGWMENVNGLPVRKRSVSTYSSPFDPIGYVFHYTVGCGSDLSTVFHSRNVSTHFSVDLEGVIYQYVPLSGKAWHADNANSKYWGVEHTAYPGTCDLNDTQLEASAKLTAALVEYTKDRWGRDIPLKKIQGSDLVPGFHDHRDGDGYHWNLNGHTDHLYHWSWAKYLEVVTSGTSSEDMGFAEFKEGWRKHRAGEPRPGDAADADVIFGWNARNEATSKPTPGSPAPHTHNYSNTVSGTTDAA